jgi:hypothetical protein
MQAPLVSDSREQLRQASDLVRHAAKAQQRMDEAQAQKPWLNVLKRWFMEMPCLMLCAVVLGLGAALAVFHVDKQPTAPPYASAVPDRTTNVPEVRAPEVRRASYVIGADYNLGTAQAPFIVRFLGARTSIDQLMRVPNPRVGDMYWVSDTGHYWFLTRVGSTQRLSWVDP